MSDSAASFAAPPGSAPDEAPRVLFHLGAFPVTSRLLARFLAAVVAVAVVSLLWGRIDIDEIHARAKAVPAVGVIAAIAVLPLIGFPVSILHLVAGVRFDFWSGILVVGATTAIHHLLGWTLVRVLPRRWFERLDPWRKKLRGAGYLDVTLLCCLLPGMPYTVQLYLKPLVGTPLWLILGLSTLLHTARAVVTILLGDISADLTPGKIAALAVYYVLLFAVSAVALRHLRRTLAMKNTDATSAPIDPVHVQSRARHLWQLAGSPPGRDDEFWLQAESELKKERAQTAEQKRGRPPGALSPRVGTPSESAPPRRS